MPAGTKRLAAALRHPVSQNVVALYALQLATYIVPLITIPYVARVLHPTTFGLVILGQNVALVLTVVIDWGFGYYAVREVAVKRDRPDELAEVVRRIRGGQILLSAVSFPVALGVLGADQELARQPVYLLFAWVAAVANGIAPNWYFLGVERMRLVTTLQLGFRFIGAGLTFAFVTGPEEGWVVMALFTAAALVSWLVSDVMLYRRVPFRAPRWRESLTAVRQSAGLFLGAVALTLYTAFNTVLLSFFEPSSVVAHFGASERVLRTAATALGPIGLAVYPRIAALQAQRRHDRARQLLAVAVAAGSVVAVVLAGALAVLAPRVISVIYGHAYVRGAVPLLRVLALIIPIGIVSGTAGFWIASLRRDRQLVTIVLGAGVLNIALGCILTPLFGPIGMAWSVVTAEGAAALAGMAVVMRGGTGRVALFARATPGGAVE